MDGLHHRDPAPRQLADLPDLLHGRRVACAESCTAGRVAAELAAVGDAADWLIGSIVAYQTAVKRELLGVRAAVVVSSQAAEEMAAGVASLVGGEVADRDDGRPRRRPGRWRGSGHRARCDTRRRRGPHP